MAKKAKQKTGRRKAAKAKSPTGQVTIPKAFVEEFVKDGAEEIVGSYYRVTAPVTWHEDGSVSVNYERRES